MKTKKQIRKEKVKIKKNTSKEDMIKLAPPCECHSCSVGCNYSGGILADEDLDGMAKFLKINIEELKEKYLDEIEKFNTKRWRTKPPDRPGRRQEATPSIKPTAETLSGLRK